MFKSVITPEMHYDDWASQYDSDIKGWGYHAPDRVRDNVRAFLSAHPSSPRMLDVGIGTGALAQKCRAIRPDIHVSGVDISRRMLDICKGRSVADDLQRIDISKELLSYDDQSFDLVTAAGLMENVEHIDNAIAEMSRVLRPGGMMAFTYIPTTRHPLREKLAKKLRPGRTEEGRFVVGDLNIFRHNPDSIKALTMAEGVRENYSEGFVGYRTYVVMTVRYDLFVGHKVKGLH